MVVSAAMGFFFFFFFSSLVLAGSARVRHGSAGPYSHCTDSCISTYGALIRSIPVTPPSEPVTTGYGNNGILRTTDHRCPCALRVAPTTYEQYCMSSRI